MKILSVVGARPQFIKAGIISRKLREKGVREIILHTGQHYDFNMSEIFFKELGIPDAHYFLGVGSGNHGEQTGKMLAGIEKVLLNEKPEVVIVYGDTNSTLAGALAASKLHIKVAHVEAGLRSFNKLMPEEINRVLTDHISDILFVPTVAAEKNLEKEGITKGVYKVGDVMLDVALEANGKIDGNEVLNKFNLRPKEFLLVTLHRAENVDDFEKMEGIINALIEISDSIKIFFPVHPRTRKKLEDFELIEGLTGSERIIISAPVSYFEMISLEKNANIIITDSGGVQKEGYFFGTPCIVARSETEWVELTDIGFNAVCGCQKSRIISTFFRFLENAGKNIVNRGSGFNLELYGSGNASERILEVLLG